MMRAPVQESGSPSGNPWFNALSSRTWKSFVLVDNRLLPAGTANGLYSTSHTINNEVYLDVFDLTSGVIVVSSALVPLSGTNIIGANVPDSLVWASFSQPLPALLLWLRRRPTLS